MRTKQSWVMTRFWKIAHVIRRQTKGQSMGEEGIKHKKKWSKQQDPHPWAKTVEKEVLPLHYACSRVSGYWNMMISCFESDKSEGQTRVNRVTVNFPTNTLFCNTLLQPQAFSYITFQFNLVSDHPVHGLWLMTLFDKRVFRSEESSNNKRMNKITQWRVIHYRTLLDSV